MAQPDRHKQAQIESDPLCGSTRDFARADSIEIDGPQRERLLIREALSNVRSAPSGTPVERGTHIGRYRIERSLGCGSFGVVYLGFDEQLERQVAIKVPHANYFSHPKDARKFMTEARAVAGLDHSNIIPVYDFGSSEQFPCFIVSRYINGMDLAAKTRKHKYSCRETAKLVATLAQALHYAHTQGIVHRDVKPGNIVLDAADRPFVADFGLALRDQDIVSEIGYAGTPAYMSPEQARGDGNRVDGRSDIFSLGVVMYELLTGRRPFTADSIREQLLRIQEFEPKPPRQINDSIPVELERICLKALEKKVGSRYSTAIDLANAIDQWTEMILPPEQTGKMWPLIQVVGSPYAYQPPHANDRCIVGRQRRRDADPPNIGCDFVIRVHEDEQQSLRISRRHFVLTRDVDGLSITDCSKSGTWLNGERLEALKPKPIQTGDMILVANVVKLQILACTADKHGNPVSCVPININDLQIVLESSLGDLTTVDPDES